MTLRRRGFTLIELLVVIGIVAVIAAILFPVVTSAKRSAMRSKCVSNLSQIARAFDAYTGDYNGGYPNTGNQYLWSGFYWRDAMRRYVGLGGGVGNGGTKQMILACPCDPTPPGVYAGTSYAYSACFYMAPSQIDSISDPNQLRAKYAPTNPKLACSTVKGSAVRLASKKVLVTEYWTLHSDKPKVGWYDDQSTGNDPWSGSRNYLFADGHVAYLATSKIHPVKSWSAGRARSLPDINRTGHGVFGQDVD